jgi:hypothetical protein
MSSLKPMVESTECEDQESAKELKNIYRTNLPAGLAQERQVFEPGTNLVPAECSNGSISGIW